jgi:hypothetical protein
MAGNATIRMVVYDILRDLKQVFPDANITPFQVTYWVMIHGDRLKKLHIQKRDTGEFISLYSDVPVLKSAIKGYYFVLPVNIYDIEMERGIEYITYPVNFDSDPILASTVFSRTTPLGMRRLYMREGERPSPRNPYFYRIGADIMLIGVDSLVLPSVDIALKATLSPNDLNMDLDQEFAFPQDLLPTLKRQILDMGRFVMMIPEDLKNDGVDSRTGKIPDNKIISVNDINNPEV